MLYLCNYNYWYSISRLADHRNIDARRQQKKKERKKFGTIDFWKCNFPLTPHVRPFVGLSVGSMVERLVCLSWFPKRAECFLPCSYWSTFIFYLYKLLHMKREKIKNIAMLAMLLVWLDLLGCEWTRSCERGRDEVDYVNVRSASNEGLWRIRKMHLHLSVKYYYHKMYN